MIHCWEKTQDVRSVMIYLPLRPHMECSIATLICELQSLRSPLRFLANKSTSVGGKIDFSIGFDTKMTTLRAYIASNIISFTEGSNILTVRRSHIIEDSIEQFTNFNNRKELKVLFEGENTSAASDAGGMSKEWFSVVSKELLNPENNIFRQ